MSTSSCKTFPCGSYDVTVSRRKNAVDIKYKEVLRTNDNTGSVSVTSSNTLRIGNADHFVPNNVVIGHGGNYRVQGQVGYVDNVATSSTINASTQFYCTGYRLFMLGGFLKCVKKEIAAMSYAYYVTYGSSTIPLQTNAASPKPRQTFYHPSAAMDFSYTQECRDFILECVDSLAKQNGVTIPDKFKSHGEHFNGILKMNYMAALDWLAYPLVRELDNPVVCRNMLHWDRNLIAPRFSVLNFKDLVQHHFGHVTPKMLEEIWKVIAVGSENEVRTYACYEEDKSMPVGPALNVKGPEYVQQNGTKHIQSYIFVLGPAIFRSMGFDYLYNALPRFGISYGRTLKFDSDSIRNIEASLTVLLKYVTPKKLISTMLRENSEPDFGGLHDTVSMLMEYDTGQKIPPQIRNQYPNGLVVDFKFKTMKELHDKVSTQYTILKTEASKREIPVSDLYGLLHGRERDGCKLIVPNNTSTLAVWGKLLNICVASYGDRAADGKCLILGVEKDGVIKYCLEFYSLIVQKIKNDMPGIVDPGKLSEPTIEPEKISVFYPKLEEKSAGVLPENTPMQEDTYFMPATAQFRGDRNCDPDPKDRAAVEILLATWVEENYEYLSTLDGIFNSNNWGGSAYWNGAVLDQNVFANILNQNNVGRADQLIVNPQAYNALQRAYQNENRLVQENQANGVVAIPIANNAVNVVVDPNVPPDEIRVVEQRVVNGAVQNIERAIIENIALAP